MCFIFDPEYLKGMFQAFSTSHLVALVVIVVCSIVMVQWLKRVKSENVKIVFCWVLSILLLSQEISRMVWFAAVGKFDFGQHLPLHLCGLSIIFGPIMLIKKERHFFEILYFWGFGGAIQALLTPDLVNEFPHFLYFQYFVSHGAIILSVVYMTFVEKFRPTWKSLIKVIIITNLFMAFVGLVNWLTNGNYMYLARKPETTTIISFLGPWPWYILSLEGVGLVMVFLLFIPFPISDFFRKLAHRKNGQVQSDVGNP